MLRINTNPTGTKHNLPSFAEGGGQRWDQYTVKDLTDIEHHIPYADNVLLCLVYSGPKQESYPQTYVTITLKMLAEIGMPESKQDIFWETKRQYAGENSGARYSPPGALATKGILDFVKNENASDPGNPDIVTE